MSLSSNRKKFIQNLKQKVAECPPDVPVYEIITQICENTGVDVESVAKVIKNDEFLRNAVEAAAIKNNMLK